MSVERQGVMREFHTIPFAGHTIWGATAEIIVNLYGKTLRVISRIFFDVLLFLLPFALYVSYLRLRQQDEEMSSTQHPWTALFRLRADPRGGELSCSGVSSRTPISAASIYHRIWKMAVSSRAALFPKRKPSPGRRAAPSRRIASKLAGFSEAPRYVTAALDEGSLNTGRDARADSQRRCCALCRRCGAQCAHGRTGWRCRHRDSDSAQRGDRSV